MNHLYYGDNLEVLRARIADESVDLIYLDPPFNSNASYNVLFKSPAGDGSQAQIEAFDDTWHWNESAELAFDEVMKGPNSDAAVMLKAMRSALGENDMMAYLAMMAVRLIELHRVLKPTGSLYLHCDPTASHYLKILLDAIFGAKNYLNELSWKRSSAHNDAKQGRTQYGNIRDIILFYSKSKKHTWNWLYTAYSDDYIQSAYRHVDSSGRRFRRDNLTAAKPGGDVSYLWPVKRPLGGDWEADLAEEYLNPLEGWEYKQVPPYRGRFWAYSQENMRKFTIEDRLVYASSGMPEYKRLLEDMPGVPLQNSWDDIPSVGGADRLGYPTQKPVALLERIISASSNPGDVVLDPFCGCGTTVHASQKLERQWIGIDITHMAVTLIEKRLKDAFPGIAYEVHGVPKDADAARDLAERDKHEFQKWIVATIGGQPYKGGRKGMDRGIDGYLHFSDENRKSQMAIISVKGGAIKSGDIRDLKGVMDREEAALGIFLTLREPTREMVKEAAAAGFYETGGQKMPRLQILTAAEVINGARPKVPFGHTESLKKAVKEKATGKQGQLF